MPQGVASYMYSRQAEEQIRMTTAYDPHADWRREDREHARTTDHSDCPDCTFEAFMDRIRSNKRPTASR